MRLALFLVALSCAAFAQFEGAEGRLLECQKACCENASGAWDGISGQCLAGGAPYNEYYRCDNACLEAAGREVGPPGGINPCCAPAIALCSISFAALAKGLAGRPLPPPE